MVENVEKFTIYLQYNCLKDYLAITLPDVKETVKTTIYARHKDNFTTWLKIQEDWQLSNYFGMRLPVELMGGSLTPECFRDKIICMVSQGSPFQMPEISLLYAQYPFKNCPPLVYDRDTQKELKTFKIELARSGYDEPLQKEIYRRKEQALLFEAKMEAVGVEKPRAEKIMKKAEAIDLLEQYSILTEKLKNAETKKQRQRARRRLCAYIKLNQEFLFKHADLLEEINQVLQPKTPQNKPQTAAAKQVEAKISEPENIAPKTLEVKKEEAKTPAPQEDITIQEKSIEPKKSEPVLTESPIVVKSAEPPLTAKSIEETIEQPRLKKKKTKKKTSIYDYLNERMDNAVQSELRILDHRWSMTKKSTLSSEDCMSNMPHLQKIATTKGGVDVKLKDTIHVPHDIDSWTDDYLKLRRQNDREIANLMARNAAILQELRKEVNSATQFGDVLSDRWGLKEESTWGRYFSGLRRF